MFLKADDVIKEEYVCDTIEGYFRGLGVKRIKDFYGYLTPLEVKILRNVSAEQAIIYERIK